MNPRVSKVYPTDDDKLKLVFGNGERGLYDCSGLLNCGVFQELRDVSYFKHVRVLDGTVAMIWRKFRVSLWNFARGMLPNGLTCTRLLHKLLCVCARNAFVQGYFALQVVWPDSFPMRVSDPGQICIPPFHPAIAGRTAVFL